MPEREGPDMSPQGIAEAVDALAQGLGRPRRPSASWQQVLVLQALEGVVHPVTPAGRILEAAIQAALVDLFLEQPALLAAIEAAFSESEPAFSEDEQTDFSQRFLAATVSGAAVMARHRIERRAAAAARRGVGRASEE